MTMRILIADGNAASRKLLKQMVKYMPNYQIIGEAVNGEDLINKVVMEKPDVALVDINMPLLDGMKAVKSCKKIVPSLQVIFITSNDKYALEAFGVQAIDYIIKPIDRNRLIAALERASAFQNRTVSIEPSPIKKDLMIKQNNQYFFIPLDDIIFIKKADRKSVIYTMSEKIEFNEALTNLEEILDSRFVSSHRSYIINLQYLYKIEVSGQAYVAHFKNYKDTAKVSKTKLAELQKNKSL
jgi:two-component system LytT family response regulator